MSLRRSNSPMGNSQRMGASRPIFEIPTEIQDKRLTRSIRGTSQDEWRPTQEKNEWKPAEYNLPIETPKQDPKPQQTLTQSKRYTEVGFRNTQSYKPTDYSAYKSEVKCNILFTIQNRNQHVFTIDYKLPVCIYIQIDQPNVDNQRTSTFLDSYKPTTDFTYQDVNRASYIQEPINSYHYQPIVYEPPKYIPDQKYIPEIYPQLNYNPEKYVPEKYTPDPIPQYVPETKYVPDPMPPSQFSHYSAEPVMTQFTKIETTRQMQQSSTAEPLKLSDPTVNRPSYLRNTLHESKMLIDNRTEQKIEQKVEQYPSVQYESKSGYQPRVIDEIIIVENPNSESQYQAQCNIF